MKRKVWAGLDLSSSIDLVAWELAIPMPEGGVRLLGRYWIPAEDMAARERRDKVQYSLWIRQGWIASTPGAVIDYGVVRKGILEDAEAFDIEVAFYDPHNATETALILRDQHGLNMVEHRQGTLSMNEPSKIFERLILDGLLEHDDNPVRNWAAGNISIKEDDNGLIRPVKPRRNSPKRIDPIVAAIMAVGGAPLQEVAGPSVYETQEGLFVLGG